MVTLQTENHTYLVYEWMIPILADLSDFDIDLIMEKVCEGKILSTPEKVEWQ